MSRREAVELVTGEVFWSDDHWATIWKRKASHWADGFKDEPSAKVTGQAADRVRYIALVQHGGGRDE